MSTTWINRGRLYCPHVTPIIVDCAFTVASSDSAGLGITGLAGQGVANVFMHTSATPGKGANGFLNPNPASGYILVQLSDNFREFYGSFAQIRSPLSGSDVAIDASDALLTVGGAYVISVLGTSTAADWLAVGVPPGVTPAVGVSFIAIATGAGTGTGKVQVPATAGSGIDHIERVGKASLSLGPIPVGGSPNVGGWLLYRCMNNSLTMNSYTPAGTNNSATPPIFTGTPATLTGTTPEATTAPANSTIIHLAMYLGQSSVKVAGE